MLLKIPDTLSLETPEQVRALRDLLDAHLLLTAHLMPVETPSVPIASAAPVLLEPPASAPQKRFGQKTAEPFYLAALEALGGAATGDEVYAKFLELGFETGAKNPRDAIKSYLRQRGKFTPLPPDEHGVVRWKLKERE